MAGENTGNNAAGDPPRGPGNNGNPNEGSKSPNGRRRSADQTSGSGQPGSGNRAKRRAPPGEGEETELPYCNKAPRSSNASSASGELPQQDANKINVRWVRPEGQVTVFGEQLGSSIERGPRMRPAGLGMTPVDRSIQNTVFFQEDPRGDSLLMARMSAATLSMAADEVKKLGKRMAPGATYDLSLVYHNPTRCANCKLESHQLVDCVGPVHPYGYIPGCPVCNVTSHYPDDCPRFMALTRQEAWDLLVVKRALKPMFSARMNWLTLADECAGNTAMFPISRETAATTWREDKPWVGFDYTRPASEQLKPDPRTKDLETINHNVMVGEIVLEFVPGGRKGQGTWARMTAIINHYDLTEVNTRVYRPAAAVQANASGGGSSATAPPHPAQANASRGLSVAVPLTPSAQARASALMGSSAYPAPVSAEGAGGVQKNDETSASARTFPRPTRPRAEVTTTAPQPAEGGVQENDETSASARTFPRPTRPRARGTTTAPQPAEGADGVQENDETSASAWKFPRPTRPRARVTTTAPQPAEGGVQENDETSASAWKFPRPTRPRARVTTTAPQPAEGADGVQENDETSASARTFPRPTRPRAEVTATAPQPAEGGVQENDETSASARTFPRPTRPRANMTATARELDVPRSDLMDVDSDPEGLQGAPSLSTTLRQHQASVQHSGTFTGGSQGDGALSGHVGGLTASQHAHGGAQQPGVGRPGDA